jgi:hypothetical protein
MGAFVFEVAEPAIFPCALVRGTFELNSCAWPEAAVAATVPARLAIWSVTGVLVAAILVVTFCVVLLAPSVGLPSAVVVGSDGLLLAAAPEATEASAAAVAAAAELACASV